MGRRKGQSWWNYIGNSIPLVKAVVKGENYQDYKDGAFGSDNLGVNVNLNNMSSGSTQNNSPNWNNYLLTGINAASNIGGALINASSQKKINEQQIQWAMQNYKMSRDDAIAFWQMENQYNSPKEQMARLKEAGLNPHLVYGNGATATGGNISSPQYQTPNLKAPQYGDAVMGAGNILATEVALAQVEKTRAETSSIRENSREKAFNNAVLFAVGSDKIAEQKGREMMHSSAKMHREIQEFDTWIASAVGQNMQLEGDFSNFGQSALGLDKTNYGKALIETFKSNEIINKAKQAGIDNTIQELVNLKKKGELYDDQHALNQIQIELQNFSKQLTAVGLNSQTATILNTLLNLIFRK